MKQQKSNQRLKAIFQASPNPIIVYNAQGHPLNLNFAFTKVFGWTLDELKGRTIPFVPEDERVITGQKIKEIFETGQPVAFETKRLTKAGKVRDVIISAAIAKGRDKAPLEMVVNITDITERKQIEARLRQAYKMEAIGTLAGGIAHDFNNILCAVIGFTELAMAGVENDNLVQRDLQEVLKAAHRAKDLVLQILTFSRQREQKRKIINIKDVVKEVLKLIRASLPTTIEIRDNLQSNSPVDADPTQIHQVLMNLCTNAGHAMQEKGGTLTVALADTEFDSDFVDTHPNLKPGRHIRLTVSDTGYGMSAHVLERIFDPFFTTKVNGEGTGMGLSVVHGIVESHGGTITVYSDPGKGTTFTIFLPVYEAGIAPENKREARIPMGTERILFVDDEMVLVNMGGRLLESLGYEVTTRTSSIEALKLFKVQPNRFDLVITDMTMPNMTGDQMAEEMMRLRADIPIILCTGFSTNIDEKRAKAMGIRAFVLKPIVKSDIAQKIRMALDQSQEKATG